MTRIVLHPQRVARWGPYGGSRVLLRRPWAWWTARFSGQDENVVTRYEPTMNNVEEASITFGRDGARVVLTDPPAAVLMHTQSYSDFSFRDMTRVYLDRSWLEARVVWHESPGPDWQPLGLPTCRPGEYRHDTTTGEVPRERERETFFEPMPMLDWPTAPTIVDGYAVPPRNFPDRCRQCERYIGEGSSGRELISGLCDECRRYGAARRLNAEEIARIYQVPPAAYGGLSINEIRAAEGLPPAPSGAEILQNLRDAYDAIARGRQLDMGGVAGNVERPSPGGRAVEVPEQRFYPGDPRNPEQNVLDAIEELVNEQLAHPEDFQLTDSDTRCPNCGGLWHGLPGDGPPALVAESHTADGGPGAESYRQVGNGGMPGCPGSVASAKAVRAWRAERAISKRIDDRGRQ